jgi:D-arabinose 5-phosphate isomerase GutQ
MNIFLRSIRYVEPGGCIATFEGANLASIEVNFRIVTRDGITGAVPDPDVLFNSGGSADEIRNIVEAVVAFDIAARGLQT